MATELSPGEYVGEMERIRKERRLYYTDYRYQIIARPEDAQPVTYDKVAVAASVLATRRALQENQRAKAQFHREEGPVLDANNLFSVPLGNRKVFGKKTRPNRASYHWCVMLDCSGSTQGARIKQVRTIAASLGEMFSRLGHGFEMYGHTTGPADASTAKFARDSYSADQIVIAKVKGPNEKWGAKNHEHISRLKASCGNLDGHATRWARKRLQSAPGNPTDRILLYVTDGEMPAANGIEERAVLKSELEFFRRNRGYAMAGLGLGVDSPKEHGLPTLCIDRDADLKQLGPFVKGLIV